MQCESRLLAVCVYLCVCVCGQPPLLPAAALPTACSSRTGAAACRDETRTWRLSSPCQNRLGPAIHPAVLG